MLAMSTRTIAALLLACLLPACDDPAAPTPAEVDLAFAIHRLQTEPPFLVSDGAGEVTVRGYMRTPCLGYEARAEAERLSDMVVLRIIGVNPGPCFAAIGNYGYQATVLGLPAGEYHLHVVHSYPDSGWGAEAVFDAEVHVQ
jgi:hypothetical protein